MSNSDVLMEAFKGIRKLAEEDNKKFEQAYYSIPPDSPRTWRRSFKVSDEYLEFKKKYWFIHDLTGLFCHSLTWYLREEGFLEKRESPLQCNSEQNNFTYA